MSELPHQPLVDAYGTYSAAVAAITSFSRVLWRLGSELSSLLEVGGHAAGTYTAPDLVQLFRDRFTEEGVQLGKDDLLLQEVLRQKIITRNKRHLRISPTATNPLALARKLLGRYRRDADLRYYVMRNIRQEYGCALSARTIHLFTLLSTQINKAIDRVGAVDKWYRVPKKDIQACLTVILRDQKESGLDYTGDEVEHQAKKFHWHPTARVKAA